jgi:kynurenine formamidase
LWYGGTTKKEIAEGESSRIGIHHWAQEGIAGRGVLLDYASWAKEKGKKFSTMDNFGISVDELNQVCDWYNVKIEPGDILFLRIGFIEEWNSLSEKQMIAYRNGSVAYHTGVEASEEMVKWLWDHHFCAVASDAVSFEVFPPEDPTFSLHHYLLAGWGIPIGEMFDLDALAKLCHEQNRYSFFVTSMPFNAVGGVSSAPNAMAIF